MLSQTFKQLEIFFLSLSTSFAPQQPQYIFFFNLLKHKKFWLLIDWIFYTTDLSTEGKNYLKFSHKKEISMRV